MRRRLASTKRHCGRNWPAIFSGLLKTRALKSRSLSGVSARRLRRICLSVIVLAHAKKCGRGLLSRKMEAAIPSKSKAQARTMAAAAHSPKWAKRLGIPPKVAKEFNRADAKTGILKGKKK